MIKGGLKSKVTCNYDFRLARQEYLLPPDCTKGTLVLMTQGLLRLCSTVNENPTSVVDHLSDVHHVCETSLNAPEAEVGGE